ncbi:hemagglutination activity protein [Sulfurifustis variabilis]|uniref:Heme exporter protein D n=1 Tax=Sulfurifustis variabilis TaxID=1675686 RepID=A0A1B4V2C0_9GAMM|nr:heme exporter protein CcmD [Sulfurifustis variabilis]BAU47678.1 hemagglutination activity protein [Sulfurifustis variabilis]
MNWSDFFGMGGYGFYVWTSYLLAAVILCVNVLLPLLRRKSVRQRLEEYQRLRDDT